jgi:hypothetical protein
VLNAANYFFGGSRRKLCQSTNGPDDQQRRMSPSMASLNEELEAAEAAKTTINNLSPNMGGNDPQSDGHCGSRSHEFSARRNARASPAQGHGISAVARLLPIRLSGIKTQYISVLSRLPFTFLS